MRSFFFFFPLLEALLVNKGRGKGDSSDAQYNTNPCLSPRQSLGEWSIRSRKVPLPCTGTPVREMG